MQIAPNKFIELAKIKLLFLIIFVYFKIKNFEKYLVE